MNTSEFILQLVIAIFTVSLSTLASGLMKNSKTDKKENILSATSSEVYEFSKSNITSQNEINDVFHYLKHEWQIKFDLMKNSFLKMGEFIKFILQITLFIGIAPLYVIILYLINLISKDTSDIIIKHLNYAVVIFFLVAVCCFYYLTKLGNKIKKARKEYNELLNKANKIY